MCLTNLEPINKESVEIYKVVLKINGRYYAPYTLERIYKRPNTARYVHKDEPIPTKLIKAGQIHRGHFVRPAITRVGFTGFLTIQQALNYCRTLSGEKQKFARIVKFKLSHMVEKGTIRPDLKGGGATAVQGQKLKFIEEVV